MADWAKQPLHLVRTAIPRPLGQRPAVLTREIAQHALDVLARLQPRLPTGEHLGQPAQQFLPVGPRHLGSLYHHRHGRLVFFLIHNHE